MDVAAGDATPGVAAVPLPVAEGFMAVAPVEAGVGVPDVAAVAVTGVVAGETASPEYDTFHVI